MSSAYRKRASLQVPYRMSIHRVMARVETLVWHGQRQDAYELLIELCKQEIKD